MYQVEVYEPLEGFLRLGRIEQQLGRLLVVVYKLPTIRPDERREPDQLKVTGSAVDVRLAVAISILREGLCGVEEVVPGPVGFGKGHVVLREQVFVVVDGQAGDI